MFLLLYLPEFSDFCISRIVEIGKSGKTYNLKIVKISNSKIKYVSREMWGICMCVYACMSVVGNYEYLFVCMRNVWVSM